MSKLRNALIAYKRQKVESQVADVARSVYWSKSSSSILRGVDAFPSTLFDRFDVMRCEEQYSVVSSLGFQRWIECQNQTKKLILYIPSIRFSTSHEYLIEHLSYFNTAIQSVIAIKIIHLRSLLTIKNLSISA